MWAIVKSFASRLFILYLYCSFPVVIACSLHVSCWFLLVRSEDGMCYCFLLIVTKTKRSAWMKEVPGHHIHIFCHILKQIAEHDTFLLTLWMDPHGSNPDGSNPG